VAVVLVGWELGNHRGHAAFLTPIVSELCRRGHEVVTVVKDLSAFGRPLESRVFQAPIWGIRPPQPGARSQTVGDDLVANGLAEEHELYVRARAWRDLVESVAPDLVLAESAPTLLLAARNRHPVIAFGSAYLLPPPGLPLPPVMDVQEQRCEASVANEERLRQAFDGVDRLLGGDGLRNFSELFAVRSWVCTLPELDPYDALRESRASGPLQIRKLTGTHSGPRSPRPLGERVFAYLKPAVVVPPLMAALARHCDRIEAYLAGWPPDMPNPWPQAHIHRAPIDIPQRLADYSTVVHFGGQNLTTEALIAGVPQLIVPQHLEQNATALAVQRLGAGHSRVNLPVLPDSERDAMTGALVAAFFGDRTLPERAAEVGAMLSARSGSSLPGLISACERVLQGGQE
jgi:UDP:flavonoid glycosyltransferase YjiC (YdhE family)